MLGKNPNRIKKPPQRAQHQMTLGSLIKALRRERKVLHVIADMGMSPGVLHRYHGDFNDVAFQPSMRLITVAELLSVCERTLMKSSIGPDETYTAPANSPIWFSPKDTESKCAIIDAIPSDGYIKLITKEMD